MGREQNGEILLLQGTHRCLNQNRTKMNDMTLVIERQHNKYGSALFVKNNKSVKSASKSETNTIEILIVVLRKYLITSFYKPPNENFVFDEPEHFRDNNVRIVVGDIYSTS